MRPSNFMVFLGVFFCVQQVARGAADPAEILIKQGVELRKAGRDREALAKFERAYEESHTARAAAQLGFCEQALQRWLEADAHLTEALVNNSDPWILRNRATIESSLTKIRSSLGLVRPRGAPQGAQVWVGEQYSGKAPDLQPVRALPGLVVVRAKADRFMPFESRVTAVAGGEATVDIAMIPQNAPLTVRSEDTRETLVGTRAPEGTTSTEAKPTGHGKAWLWTGIGVVAVSAIVLALVLSSSPDPKYPSFDTERNLP